MKPTKFSFLIACFFSYGLFAQNAMNKTDLIAGTFKSLFNNYSEQKIVLQTDRQLYITGEKIWFKAFVINSYTQKVDLTSKNLFVDFVDDSDNVISKLILNNEQLKTSGAIVLPDTIKTGFYWLRGYTAKMLQHPENIFIQPLFVLNKSLHDENSYLNKYKNTFINKKQSAAIQFFPERLTGIENIISTGVLKLTDENNNPLITTGTIVNSNDSVITTFETNRLGLSRITFIDDAALKYSALFSFNGSTVKYELPSIDHHAAQLSVTNQTGKNLKAFVTLEDALPAHFQTMILGLHGDSLCYAAIGNGTYGIKIPLENFPGGISSLLLFDENRHLLDERDIYINKENYELEIKTDKTNYSARDNVKLNIKLKNEDGEPMASALNISVQDAWLAQLADSLETNNFPPSDKFLLSNWISVNQNNLTATDIDLLMATIRSFNKNPVQYDESSVSQYDDNSRILNLTGKITGRKNTPGKNLEITVMSKSITSFFIDADTTKADGGFKIQLPQNMDSLSLALQVREKNTVITPYENVSIDSFTFPVLTTPLSLKQQFLNYNVNWVSSLRKFHIDTAITFQGKGWLTPIVVTTVEKKPLNYDESKRINSVSQILTSDKFRYGGMHAVSNALLSVPGVSMLQGDLIIFGYTPTANMKGFLKPLLVVDGVVMGDAGLGYFDELSPADVDFIEVLRGGEAAYYGMRGAGGVISVNMKHGSPPDFSRNSFLIFKPVTYHVCPQFYMPDYSVPEIKKNQTQDPRTTIYWNSNITTGEKGQAVVHFYTADIVTNYAVTVTGLSAKGDIVYKRVFIGRN